MQFALLDDATATTCLGSRLYRDPCAIVRCPAISLEGKAGYQVAVDQITSLLHQAENYLAQGCYAVFIGRYELASVLHQIPAHTSTEPLFEIHFYRHCVRLDKQQVDDFLSGLIVAPNMQCEGVPQDEPAGVMNVQASIDQAQFNQAVAKLQAYLAQGDSYQINLTYRLVFQTYGSVIKLYQRLRQRQPVTYSALIKLDTDWILSFSPELFVRREGSTLYAKPMKGTALRSGQNDCAESQSLAKDIKNRTENLIIVDLLRNDLGRISVPGSVTVPQLFEVEAYPTVWQMTSTISAQSLPGLNLWTLLQALFPCGSVTGAPKRRSLEIIHELETTPRRLYCGALGWFDPPTSIFPLTSNACVVADNTKSLHERDTLGDFCLAVPIRTLLIDQHGRGELGIGAGITYDSSAVDEYAECQLKAKFLTGLSAEFDLFETLALTGQGYLRLALHLQRLKKSAQQLGFVYPEASIFYCLQEAMLRLAQDHHAHLPVVINRPYVDNSDLPTLDAASQARQQPCTDLEACDDISLPATYHRAHLALSCTGDVQLTVHVINRLTMPVKLLWAQQTTHSHNPLLRYKTTHRAIYDKAWQAAENLGAFDALFCNERGEVTEGGRSNVFAQIDGVWCTPALDCGVLPGVMRAQLIKQLSARECVLKREDMMHAQALLVCNSLRGILSAVLI